MDAVSDCVGSRRRWRFLLLLAVWASTAAGAAAAGSSPGVASMRHVVVYQDPAFYCAFPSVVRLPDGGLVCAFRRAPDRRALWGAPGCTHTDPNSYLVLVRSADDGLTWSQEPELIYAHPLGGSQDPCLALLEDGSLVCSSYAWALVPPEGQAKVQGSLAHPPFAFLGGYVLRSVDGGRTWKGPFVPPSLPGEASKDALGRPCPAFNRGAMLQMPDGSLLWAVARTDSLQPRRSSVHLLRSSDRGETWSYVCPVAEDPEVTFNETSLVRTRSGDIVAFMRTAGLEGSGAVARSRDGGRSFGKWEDAGVFGHPFHAVTLPDGRVFVVYGHRREPFGIRARLLDPECSGFGTAPEIILRDDGGNQDIGYPWAVVLPGGRVLVVYYFNVADGTRHIAGTVITFPEQVPRQEPSPGTVRH